MSVRIPRYRLHKPSGRAVVTITGRYYYGEDGSDASKAEYGPLMAELVSGGDRNPPQISVI